MPVSLKGALAMNRMLPLICLSVLLIVCVPITLFAQTGTVTGEARFQGKGMQGVVVWVSTTCTRSGRVYDAAITDDNGQFTMRGLETGPTCLELYGKGDGKTRYTGGANVNVVYDATSKARPNPVRLKETTLASLRDPGSKLLLVQLTRISFSESQLQPSESDNSFQIAGTVTASEDSKKVLDVVQIVLTEAASRIEKFATTVDLKGKKSDAFNVAIDEAADYFLTFSANGFRQRRLLVFGVPADPKKSKPATFGVFESNGDPVSDPQSLKIKLEPMLDGPDESFPEVQTEEAARRFVSLPQQMEALPVPGLRSFDYFALLAPGVAPPPQTYYQEGLGVSPGIGTAGQFAVNGLRSRENNFTVDGSDNNDEDIGARRQGFLALTPQTIESLQEYQIITALADSRFGRNLGGQINALTKTGSPEFHGSAYGFLTSDRFNARNFFDQVADGTPPAMLRRSIDNTPVLLDGQPIAHQNPVGGKDSLKRTQVGFTVGGPFQPLKNTFFFGSLEHKDIRATKESHFAVPTVRQRGFFETGETGLLLLPPFVGPSTPLFPASIPGNALFSLYPFPNNPGGPYGENTYTAVLPADGKATLISGKLDKQFGTITEAKPRRFWSLFSQGDILTGRYNFTQDAVTLPTTGEAIFSSLRPRVRTQNIAFFLNRTLSANTSDTIRFSFGRTRLLFDEVRDPYLTPSFLRDTPFLLNAPLLLNVTAPNANGTLNPTRFVSASSAAGTALLNSLGYPSITQTEQITGPLGQVILPGFSSLGVDAYSFPQSRANNTIQVADTITHVRNKHIFTFGFDVRKTQINSTLDRNFRPVAVFDGLFGVSSPNLDFITLAGGSHFRTDILTGASLAAAGVPTGLFHTLAVTPTSAIGIRFTQGSFFVQDEWRLKPHFLLIAGLRYGRNSVPDTVGKRVEKALDPQELKRLAEEASQTCNPPIRCGDLVPKLTAAFPNDFTVSFGSDKNDFDVRLGFVANPRKFSDFIIRGGFGTYSGQFPGIVLDQSRNAFPNFLPLNYANFSPRLGGVTYLFNLANPNLQQLDPNLRVVSPGTLNSFPGSNPINLLANRLVSLQNLALFNTILGLDLVLPQRKLRTAYSMQSAVSIERSFGGEFSLTASYLWTRGEKLLRISTPQGGVNDTNIASSSNLLKVNTLTNQSSFPFFQGFFAPRQGDTISKSFVIAPTFFNSDGTSRYHSLQLEARKRYSWNFQFGSVLTYSHAIDDASDFVDSAGSFALPQHTDADLTPAGVERAARSERASSSFDVRLRSVTSFVVDIPYLSRKVGALKSMLAKLQLAGVVTAQSGQPYTVNTIFDVNRDGNLTDRLDNTAGLIQGSFEGDRRTQLRLAPGVNPLTLLGSLLVHDGAVARNTFRAPGVVNVDISLSSSMRVRDHDTIQYRLEVFNLCNRTDFGIPVRILEQPGFGKSTGTTIPARTVQFSLKYNF